jgi:drug/metabolite transporter (DMT)-like permease
MSWQLAISISIIASVFVALVQRQYALRTTAPATFPSAVSYLLGVTPVGLFAGILIFPNDITWSWWLCLLLILGASSMAIAMWTGFQAAKRLAVAPRQTIGCLSIVTAIILGWTILGEGLTASQSSGAILLLTAAILAIWAPTRRMGADAKRIHFGSVLIAIVAAVAFGIGLVTEKAIAGHMEIGGVFLVGWTTQTIAMVLLATKDMSRQAIRNFRRYDFTWSTIMGVLSGFTGVFYVYAIVHADNISLVTAITAIAFPLTILAAYLILHERENRLLMWLSIALGFVGIIFTSL